MARTSLSPSLQDTIQDERKRLQGCHSVRVRAEKKKKKKKKEDDSLVGDGEISDVSEEDVDLG